MKNPNLSKKQIKQIAMSFNFDNWSWLNTQMAFLDALDAQTEEEIRALASVLLTQRLNATL